eukprot:TRINITY_DN16711_c0_g1_i1.p1 TRINITY_DN16711_c0_g1~~TRINITY_DN16711_c0_g1_i1.p1  ORF type:complete len:1154 (-),score=160.20 TRINITY_DN16711_c0_g1_i1:262-3723(-)
MPDSMPCRPHSWPHLARDASVTCVDRVPFESGRFQSACEQLRPAVPSSGQTRRRCGNIAKLGLLVATLAARSCDAKFLHSHGGAVVWSNTLPPSDVFREDLEVLREELADHSVLQQVEAEPLDYPPCALRQWLQNLKIYIPDTTVKSSIYTIAISDSMCQKFDLVGIETSAVSASSSKIAATGLSASCIINLHITGFLVDTKLEATAAVGDSDIEGSLAVVASQGNPPLPKALSTTDCKGNIQITSLHFSGSVVGSILELLHGVITSILNKALGKIVCDNVDKLINVQGSAAVVNASKAIQKILGQKPVSPSPPQSLPGSPSQYADFVSNPGFVFIRRLIDGMLGNFSNKHNVNSIMSRLLGAAGTASLDRSGLLPVHLAVPVADLGTVNVSLQSLSLTGLNTWQKMATNHVAPDDPPAGRHEFGMDVGIGRLGVNATVVMTIKAGHGAIQGQTLTEKFNINVSMRDMTTGGLFYAALDTHRLSQLSLDQLACAGCLGGGIPAAQEAGSHLSLGDFDMAVKPDGVNLEQDVDNMLNTVLQQVLRDFRQTINAVSDKAMSVTVRDAVNRKINQTLLAGKPCMDPLVPYVYQDVANGLFWSSLAIFLVGLVSLFMPRLILKVIGADKMAKTAPVSPTASAASAQEVLGACASISTTTTGTTATGGAALLPSNPSDPAQSELDIGRTTPPLEPPQKWDCLAFHPRVPIFLKISLPVFTVATILGFLGANLGAGAVVHAYITVNGETVMELPPVFQFSLLSTINDFYHAEAWVLMVVIALFSGIWPYVKLLMCMAVWFAPVKKLSLEKRMQMLNFLDAYGKWSFVDSIFLIVFSVAFKIDLGLDLKTLPPEVKEAFKDLGQDPLVRVMVVPAFGFHAFLIATIASLALGMVLTATNRYALRIGEFSQTSDSTGGGRLCNVLRPANYWYGKVFAYGPVSLLAASLVLVLTGLVLPSFEFRFSGILAFILGPEDSVRRFSVLTISDAIPAASPHPNDFGVRWIQAMFILFVILVVITYHAILICLWCAPLSPRKQRHFLVASQVLNAWSGLDVFVASIICSVFEIQSMADFMVGHKCDAIDNIADRTPIGDHIPGGRPVKCFALHTHLEAGFWILTTAAIVSTAVGHIMIRRCSVALCSSFEGARPRDTAITMEASERS